MYLGLAEFVKYVGQREENYRNKSENNNLKYSEKSAGKTVVFRKEKDDYWIVSCILLIGNNIISCSIWN